MIKLWDWWCFSTVLHNNCLEVFLDLLFHHLLKPTLLDYIKVRSIVSYQRCHVIQLLPQLFFEGSHHLNYIITYFHTVFLLDLTERVDDRGSMNSHYEVEKIFLNEQRSSTISLRCFETMLHDGIIVDIHDPLFKPHFLFLVIFWSFRNYFYRWLFSKPLY